MQIGIAGYGKMGNAVERIALERGHAVQILDIRNLETLKAEEDVVIDFTNAEVAEKVVRWCISGGLPVVSGTTGWNAEKDVLSNEVRDLNGSFIWAPNFSVGMYITFAVNRMLARLMNGRPEYDVTIEEIHHTAKKDAPSGTAIALATQILEAIQRKSSWGLEPMDEPDASILKIKAIREADVKGLHDVRYDGPHDIISLRHEAKSRDGFALGAVLAAEWLIGKTGVFSFENVMADLLGGK